MKVSYLHIRNYKQFSDLELDLTYPRGHVKAGKPLDKICIIGQSGTGKTNLLDIIKKSTIDFSGQPKNSYLPFSEFVGKDTDDRYITTAFVSQDEFIAETLFSKDTSTMNWDSSNYELDENEINYYVSTNKNPEITVNGIFDEKLLSRTDASILKGLEKRRKIIEHQGIGIFDKLDSFEEKFVEIDNAIESLKKKYTVTLELNKLKYDNLINKSIIDINETNNTWKLLKERINNYEIEKTKYTKKLSHKLLSDDDYAKEEYKKDMALWEEDNENILQKIATDINMIIQEFNLELHIDEDTQSYEELIIKDLSNNTIIEYDDLSTGTKNLLSTFIPLKSHKPKDSIILIDEPEMSFYPDIQRQLTNLYMKKVGENNQLIMATHSPLIASSFEPWEVVELKFDKNNQIYREKYYEGDNHVDNYTVDPRMLTWTGILTDIFDLKEDSNFSFREKKLMEYATLKAEIKAMEDMSQKEEKFKELKKISKILGLGN